MAEGTCAVGGCGKVVVARGWCESHYRRWRRHGSPTAGDVVNNDAARFWSKVAEGATSAAAPELGPCWIWQRGCYPRGYGHFSVRTNTGERKHVQAHRWAYEFMVGLIPGELELDHLCRVTSCVNPYHLDPVPHVINARRGDAGINCRSKTHCPQNHPYDADNTYLDTRGRRVCRRCQRAAQVVYGKKRGTRARRPKAA